MGVSSFFLSAIVGLSLHIGVDAALACDGQRPRELALGLPQARGVVQLAGRGLHAQAEQVALRRGDVVAQTSVRHVAQVGRAHQPSSRNTNLVLTGSLWPARRIASRASGSGTPDSSNITRPGFTTATQPSGEPFPEPMRVSAGFLVNDLSGNTLIQTLPPRLILRVMAIRAASIWRLVSHPASSDLSPYSPNSTRC